MLLYQNLGNAFFGFISPSNLAVESQRTKDCKMKQSTVSQTLQCIKHTLLMGFHFSLYIFHTAISWLDLEIIPCASPPYYGVNNEVCLYFREKKKYIFFSFSIHLPFSISIFIPLPRTESLTSRDL